MIELADCEEGRQDDEHVLPSRHRHQGESAPDLRVQDSYSKMDIGSSKKESILEHRSTQIRHDERGFQQMGVRLVARQKARSIGTTYHAAHPPERNFEKEGTDEEACASRRNVTHLAAAACSIGRYRTEIMVASLLLLGFGICVFNATKVPLSTISSRCWDTEAGQVCLLKRTVKYVGSLSEAGFGASLATSRDGSVIAIGSTTGPGDVLVLARRGKAGFVLQGDRLVGPPKLHGNLLGTDFGYAIALSGDGNILAVGAPLYREVNTNSALDTIGQVFVLRYDGRRWNREGHLRIPTFDAELGQTYRFGERLALSGDGTVLAATSSGVDGMAQHPKESTVRVYHLAGDTWIRLGQALTLSSFDDGKPNFGMALSRDGSTVAMGVGTTLDGGRVQVFRFEDGEWHRIGQEIHLRASETGSTAIDGSIALSGDGDVLALGEPVCTNSSEASKKVLGRVQVFQYSASDGSWVNLGGVVTEQYEGECGQAVALSENGTDLVVGVPEFKASRDSSSGLLRVHEYLDGQWQIDWQMFGDQVLATQGLGDQVTLSDDGQTIVASGSEMFGTPFVIIYNKAS